MQKLKRHFIVHQERYIFSATAIVISKGKQMVLEKSLISIQGYGLLQG